MKKVLILYFSGAGNTKYVAEYMCSRIEKQCMVAMKSVEEMEVDFDFSQYDKLIIGTPTIHSEPVKPIKEYLTAIKRLKNPIPAFLFATYGLYPENVLRVLADLCMEKNIIPVHYSGYRCRANDGNLLFPWIHFLTGHEKQIEQKISRDMKLFLSKDDCKLNRPKYKWYAIINYPNKWLGQHYHFKIYLHKAYCKKCGKCEQNCPRQAIIRDESEYPVIDREKCMNCYRCIYDCPFMALSLFKKKRHKLGISK